MSGTSKPDRRLPSAESQRQQIAASAETQKPSDSVPVVSGQFTNLPMRFGRYQVEKLLGRGAMAAVYLARDTELDRKVALKIPKVSATGAKRLLLRLKTEAKAAAQLDHSSLCKVYDAGEVDGQCFIAMKFIEGETLKAHLENGRKSVEEAVSLILQLAEGLSEAHELGIVHRDLKPENIMMTRRGVPVIMDFGLAKFSTINSNAFTTQAGTILGSPAYMSPEQASGNIAEIDQRSDIYSLGVIFFELLTETLPFTGATMQILGQKSILDPLSPLETNPDLPSSLAATCHKMIARNPADRYQTLNEVIADLRLAGNAEFSRRQDPDFSQDPAMSLQDAVLAASQETPANGFRSPKVRGRKSLMVRTGNWLSASWNTSSSILKLSALGSVGALFIALGIFFYYPTANGTLRIEIEDPQISVRFDDQSITIENDGKPIRIAPSEKKTLEILVDGTTIESPLKEVTVKRGELRLVKISLVDGKVNIDDPNGPQKRMSAVVPQPFEKTQVVETAASKVVAPETADSTQKRKEKQDDVAPEVVRWLPVGSVFKGNWSAFDGGNSTGESTMTLRITRRVGNEFAIEWELHDIIIKWIVEGTLSDEDTPTPILTAAFNKLLRSENGFHGIIGNNSVNGTVSDDGKKISGNFIWTGTNRTATWEATLLDPKDLPDPKLTHEGIVNGDFANGLDGWEREAGATAFHTNAFNGTAVSTFGAGREGDKGRIFQTFKVPQNAASLDWYVHGGRPQGVYISLIHNDQVYKRTSGFDSNIPSRVSWDIKPIRGETVTLEIVDKETGAWGFIGASDFKLLTET